MPFLIDTDRPAYDDGPPTWVELAVTLASLALVVGVLAWAAAKRWVWG